MSARHEILIDTRPYNTFQLPEQLEGNPSPAIKATTIAGTSAMQLSYSKNVLRGRGQRSVAGMVLFVNRVTGNSPLVIAQRYPNSPAYVDKLGKHIEVGEFLDLGEEGRILQPGPFQISRYEPTGIHGVTFRGFLPAVWDLSRGEAKGWLEESGLELDTKQCQKLLTLSFKHFMATVAEGFCQGTFPQKKEKYLQVLDQISNLVALFLGGTLCEKEVETAITTIVGRSKADN